MRTYLLTLFNAVCILSIGTPSAFGWSEGGHHIIASLAYQMLDDADKQAIVELMKQQTNKRLSSF